MRMRLLVLAVVTTGSFLIAPSANAQATVVRGDQILVESGPCFDANAAISTEMSGGLVGCWWVDTFDFRGAHPSGTFQAVGTEHFIGCLDLAGDGCGGDDPTGSFSTTYLFTGKFDASGAEIHGRCHHPIVWGTDGFANVTGVINFTDDVTTGNSSYTGAVRP